MDDEVRRVTEAPLHVFKQARRARRRRRIPDFTEIAEIVRTSRGLAHGRPPARQLPQWKSVMQDNLVRNIEQGLALTPAEIGHGERLRTELFHRVRRSWSATT